MQLSNAVATDSYIFFISFLCKTWRMTFPCAQDKKQRPNWPTICFQYIWLKWNLQQHNFFTLLRKKMNSSLQSQFHKYLRHHVFSLVTMNLSLFICYSPFTTPPIMSTNVPHCKTICTNAVNVSTVNTQTPQSPASEFSLYFHPGPAATASCFGTWSQHKQRGADITLVLYKHNLSLSQERVWESAWWRGQTLYLLLRWSDYWLTPMCARLWLGLEFVALARVKSRAIPDYCPHLVHEPPI